MCVVWYVSVWGVSVSCVHVWCVVEARGQVGQGQLSSSVGVDLNFEAESLAETEAGWILHSVPTSVCGLQAHITIPTLSARAGDLNPSPCTCIASI